MNGDSFQAPGRILLVEDDPDTGRYITEVLTRRGRHTVVHALTGQQAVEHISQDHWDLVLTDVEMPGMTGIELLSRIRELAPGTPVAVITAHPTVSNAVGAVRGKADEFLEKPIRPGELTGVVERLIEAGRAQAERVLAVGAHPDDVEIGAGGALLAHRAAGHSVSILTMSRGARGGTSEDRISEARAAARKLGAKLHLENLEDTRISEGDPTISAIIAVLDQVQPTIVYTHSTHDVHQDHRNTHRAVMVAARGVGSVYCFQSPSATVDFRPNRFTDIDQQLAAKLAAIGAFASQTAIREYLEPDLIAATARYWSRFAHGRFAEAFEVVRDRAAGTDLVPLAGPAFVTTGRIPEPATGGEHAAS